MPKILQTISVLQFLFGAIIFMSAKSAIHEILGTLMIGFAIMTFALAAILAELKKNQSEDGKT